MVDIILDINQIFGFIFIFIFISNFNNIDFNCKMNQTVFLIVFILF